MSTQREQEEFDAMCHELADTLDLVDDLTRQTCTPEYLEAKLREITGRVDGRAEGPAS